MQVNLSWLPVPNALYYNIYRATSSGGPYQLIAQSNPASGQAATSYQDGPDVLQNGIDYFYVVSTVTVDGESAYSAEVVCTAPSQPISPSNLTALIQ